MGEDRSKLPRFILEADRRAAELGITRQEVLDGDRKLLENGPLPNPDCLDQEDMARLLRPAGEKHEWVESHLKHVEQCAVCGGMLFASEPKARSKDHLIGLIQGRAGM